MSASYLPVLAAFAGSAIGGLAVLISSWVTQNRMNSADWLARFTVRRQDLYKQFIEEAAKLYAHSLLHEEPDIAGLARVYALVDQMRVLSSVPVIEEAESVVRTIVDTYSAPNRTFQELRGSIGSKALHPLLRFSEKCREELGKFVATPILLAES
jgi:hypothetical protein